MSAPVSGVLRSSYGPTTPIRGPLALGRFVERPNRFVVRVTLEAGAPPDPDDDLLTEEESSSAPASGATPGTSREAAAEFRLPGGGNRPRAGSDTERTVSAHLPDPGRLEELLVPGRRLWLRPEDAPHRKTRYTAVLVETPCGGGLVSVDTTLPNRLIRSALEADALPELDDWSLVRCEFPSGRSRLDFLLERADGRRMALEVKSVTLVEDGVARFPDAVTARGARHVEELAALAGRPGWEAGVLFVLQRPDAGRIEAARAIDPAFADALEEAREAGVRIWGRRCRVGLDGVTLGEPVPAAPA